MPMRYADSEIVELRLQSQTSPLTQNCYRRDVHRLFAHARKPLKHVGLDDSHRFDKSLIKASMGRTDSSLTPSINHLFDRGFFGLRGNGELIVSPVAHRPSLERMGINTKGAVNVGTFTTGQREFLEFHRDMVLLKAAR